MAHLLTDEAFALSIGHFRRLGRTDERGYWIARDRLDVHPVEPRDARRRPARRPDPGPGPVRHRRHLPGGDDRARGRAHHRAARAGRRDRRGGVVAVVVALSDQPGDRDRDGRRARAAGRPARPGRGRARDARRSGPRRRPSRMPCPATHDRPATTRSPTDEHEPRPAGRPDVRGDLPVAGARAARRRASTGCRRVALDYLQLVGPAVLAALAAVSVMVDRRRR